MKRMLIAALAFSLSISLVWSQSLKLSQTEIIPGESHLKAPIDDSQGRFGKESSLETIDKNSGDDFFKIFENMACKNVGSYITNDKIELYYCSTVKNCKDIEGNSLIDQQDKDFLNKNDHIS